MSAYEGEPPLAQPEEDLTSLFESVERARSSLFDTASIYVHDSVKPNAVALVDASKRMTLTLHEFTGHILFGVDYDDEETATVLSGMFDVDCVDRAKYFNKLTKGRQGFTSSVNREAMTDNILQAISEGRDADDLLKEITVAYDEELCADINKLFGYTLDKPERKFTLVRQLVGEHALDAVKVGTGAVIGFLVIREWGRQHIAPDRR